MTWVKERLIKLPSGLKKKGGKPLTWAIPILPFRVTTLKMYFFLLCDKVIVCMYCCTASLLPPW